MNWKRTSYEYGKSSDEQDWVVLVETREIIARVKDEAEAKALVEKLRKEQSQ